MNTYALKFEAQPNVDIASIQESFYEHFDGLLAESFGRLLITVYVDGHANGIMAVKFAVMELERQLGIQVLRIDRDLVDASEISRRIDRTRENVRQLISGTRRKGSPFPTPIASPNGKMLWEWSIVNEWLRRNVPEASDEELGLSRDEMTSADGWILRWRTMLREQHLILEFNEVVSGVPVHFPSRARSGSANKAWIESWNTTRYDAPTPAVSTVPSTSR